MIGLKQILNEIVEHVESEKARQARRESSTYWARCPRCGRKQVRENLLKNGCFVCGWEGTEEELQRGRGARE